jgi:hypothetical protein
MLDVFHGLLSVVGAAVFLVRASEKQSANHKRVDGLALAWFDFTTRAPYLNVSGEFGRESNAESYGLAHGLKLITVVLFFQQLSFVKAFLSMKLFSSRCENQGSNNAICSSLSASLRCKSAIVTSACSCCCCQKSALLLAV